MLLLLLRVVGRLGGAYILYLEIIVNTTAAPGAVFVGAFLLAGPPLLIPGHHGRVAQFTASVAYLDLRDRYITDEIDLDTFENLVGVLLRDPR